LSMDQHASPRQVKEFISQVGGDGNIQRSSIATAANQKGQYQADAPPPPPPRLQRCRQVLFRRLAKFIPLKRPPLHQVFLTACASTLKSGVRGSCLHFDAMPRFGINLTCEIYSVNSREHDFERRERCTCVCVSVSVSGFACVYVCASVCESLHACMRAAAGL